MILNDQKKIVFARFRGVFNRGDPDEVPLDHLADALNLRFRYPNQCYTREGVSRGVTLSYANGRATRFYALTYTNAGTTSRVLLILDDAGNIIRGDTMAIMRNFGGNADFRACTMFNKAFYAVQNTQTQLFNPSLSVVNREIGCFPPINNETAAGNFAAVDGALGAPGLGAGLHLLYIVLQNDTGYISYPGPIISTGNPAQFLSGGYNAPGGKKVNLTGINIRGAYPFVDGGNVTAVQFLATKAGLTQAFFVPSKDVTYTFPGTTATLDFPDSDLVSDASYLFNERCKSPQAMGVTKYNGRLVLWSTLYGVSPQFNLDVQINPSLLLISKSGEPEHFDNTTGFYIVNKDDGQAITNALWMRGGLHVFKTLGVYVVVDNGSEPASWPTATPISEDVSIPLHGIGVVQSDAKGFADSAVIADRSGLLLYDGTVRRPELTWKVRGIWDRVNKASGVWFNQIELVIDPFNRCLYCAVPLDSATTPSHILYGDFSEGLDHANMKWDLWKPHKNPSCIGMLDLTTPAGYGNAPSLYFGTLDTSAGFLWKLDPTKTDDDGVAINSYGKTWAAYFRASRTKSYEGWLHYFNALKAKIKGSGSLAITLYGQDGNPLIQPFNWTLLSAPARDYYKGTHGARSEKCSVQFGTNALGANFALDRLDLYCQPMFEARPGGQL